MCIHHCLTLVTRAAGPPPPPPPSSLESNAFSGGLPASWGKSPAFPRLKTLSLAGSSSLGGELPPAWGSGKGLQVGWAGQHRGRAGEGSGLAEQRRLQTPVVRSWWLN